MIPKECKRLAEVDFPIAVVSKWAAKEKSIRHGHPSTLHLWWARRPLAACRAMLLALLLPDPCDEHCPPEFKTKARELLAPVQREVDASDKDLQKALLKFIGDFANWDLAGNRTYLEVSRGLVKAAHLPDLSGGRYEPPLVVDPFAGGGSIPLEALRLGCEAFASDLNPVACLILKVMLEDIPRHGPKLAEELRRVGTEIKAAAEKELADFYPPDPDGARPIAYLWARTVRCESPNCGAEIPLVRSFWLSKKANRKRALRYRVVAPASSRQATDQGRQDAGATKGIEFEVFEPASDRDVPAGTVTRAKATCPCCQIVLSPERVRAQLAAQRGGADVIFNERGDRIGGARLLAVVTLKPGKQGRNYRLPAARDYEAVRSASASLAALLENNRRDGSATLSPVPDEPLPPIGTLGFRVQRYGMLQWGDLFTARQKLALVTLCRRAQDSLADLRSVLGLALSRVAERLSSLARWDNSSKMETVAGTFSRQALPIVWDFAEQNPFEAVGGNWDGAIEWIALVAEASSVCGSGQAHLCDAAESPLPDASSTAWFTDPPYYDAVPYADLSDFFLVWLKRALPNHPLLRDPFDPTNPLTPKIREIVQDEVKHVNGHAKDRAFFEETMALAFAEGRRILKEDGVGAVVFAHKTTEGWEALLSGMSRGGWVITGSWPIATEMASRMRARESAALATSVHLVCRPRTDDRIGDWGEVYHELPKRVGDWIERLQSEGVRGADLVFACIGPALEIYSRYAKVVDAEEREIPLGGDPEATEPHKRGYLAYVWEAVGRAALEQVLGTAEARARNGAAGALEEDARLTALFLWTLQSTNGDGTGRQDAGAPGEASDDSDDDEDEQAPRVKKKGLSLIFDVVRRFAQPLGIHLPDWEDRIIETDKGVVRLLPVTERAKQLFGEDGAEAVADQLEHNPKAAPQLSLFPNAHDGGAVALKGRGRKPRRSSTTDVADRALQTRREATTLDRVHAAMLLQSAGRANTLRALLKAEQDRGPDFLRPRECALGALSKGERREAAP